MKRRSIPLTLATVLLALASVAAQPEQAPAGAVDSALVLSVALECCFAGDSPCDH